MAKGKKTGGRRAGSPNRTTASVKAALKKAFDNLGGVPALVAWAKDDPGEFYKLYIKLLPIEVKADVHHSSLSDLGERLRRAKLRDDARPEARPLTVVEPDAEPEPLIVDGLYDRLARSKRRCREDEGE